MREYTTLECTECKRRNYRTETDTRGPGKLKLKKFCRFCRKHTVHNEHRK
jgi:large subunit ribosomal protein L33